MLNTITTVQVQHPTRGQGKNTRFKLDKTSTAAMDDTTKAFKIYRLINRVTGLAYVGVTDELHYRLINHRSDASNPKSAVYTTKLSAAIREYGFDAFDVYLVDSDDNKDDALDLERQYVDYYGTFANGYNSAMGGKGRTGIKQSAEHIRKRSESLRRAWAARKAKAVS